MKADCPKGTPSQTVLFANKNLLFAAAPVKTASRIRKDIEKLGADELAKLKLAFEGIMKKDPSDPNSYFAQAGIHWLPEPDLWCMHHAPAYNPWHRAYMYQFENALRSVEGCEDVTLPYWDITKPFPEVLKSAPFDAYTFQQDVGNAPLYNLKGKQTYRDTYDNIAANLLKHKVAEKVHNALRQPTWENFHGYFVEGVQNVFIINAHDMGHNSIGGPGVGSPTRGGTMSDQDVAAFDPIFWFFHSNWDRLYWKWQKKMRATTLNGLLSTIDKIKDRTSFQTFTDDTVGALPPFPQKAAEIIDSVTSLDVDYEDDDELLQAPMLNETRLASFASRKFTVKSDLVNVRVKGLNRLKVPGSFYVHLLRDGEIIATTGFFQPHEVEKCASCVKNAIVNFDFELPLTEINQGKLGVKVVPFFTDFVGDEIPAKLMGDPTVEVHFIVSNG
jgi:hypothetical protein